MFSVVCCRSPRERLAYWAKRSGQQWPKEAGAALLCVNIRRMFPGCKRKHFLLPAEGERSLGLHFPDSSRLKNGVCGVSNKCDAAGMFLFFVASISRALRPEKLLSVPSPIYTRVHVVEDEGLYFFFSSSSSLSSVTRQAHTHRRIRPFLL